MTALVDDWTAAMRQGDFTSAWAIADRALDSHRQSPRPYHLPRHQQWLWDGRPLLDRRVLVHCYHGLGDTLQFARFIPELSEIAADVVLWAQPPLVPLLRTLACTVAVLPLYDGPPHVERDVDIELMELAHALRITPADLGRSVPYLHVPPAPRLTSRFAVGVVLQAGDWDARRSMPRAALGELDPRLDWFSLQPDAVLAGMTDLSTPDMRQLAARLQSLDLVISVDTMVAHLAGALGVPTWTLLPFNADWRWQRDRPDSPWYPSMRLVRQPRPRDWASVGAVVRSQLQCVH
jgi:Glycosyltransferase family 9 (heptosyltransferase)